MERYHIYKLGIAILFYAVYCRRPMVNGLEIDAGVGTARNQSGSTREDYYVYYQGVQGKPGVDFPVHARIPRTGFSCKEVESGYYADLDTDCQVFHICNEGTKVSFLCPNGTIFQQSDLICDWWFKVNCTNSPNLYEESAEQLRESNARRKASRRVYLNDAVRKMDVSEEMQVGAESAGFYGSGLNSIATTQKERNPYPNHRTTYSELKHYTNLPVGSTPATAAKSTINNGKPFVVSTPKLGAYPTERTTFRYSPTVPAITTIYSTYKQGKTTFGVRSTPRVQTFTDPPSVSNGKSTTPRKAKNKNSFTIGLNSLQGAVALKPQTVTPKPQKGVIRLSLSSDGGAKSVQRGNGRYNHQDYENAGHSNDAKISNNKNAGSSVEHNGENTAGQSHFAGYSTASPNTFTATPNFGTKTEKNDNPHRYTPTPTDNFAYDSSTGHPNNNKTPAEHSNFAFNNKDYQNSAGHTSSGSYSNVGGNENFGTHASDGGFPTGHGNTAYNNPEINETSVGHQNNNAQVNKTFAGHPNNNAEDNKSLTGQSNNKITHAEVNKTPVGYLNINAEALKTPAGYSNNKKTTNNSEINKRPAGYNNAGDFNQPSEQANSAYNNGGDGNKTRSGYANYGYNNAGDPIKPSGQANFAYNNAEDHRKPSGQGNFGYRSVEEPSGDANFAYNNAGDASEPPGQTKGGDAKKTPAGNTNFANVNAADGKKSIGDARLGYNSKQQAGHVNTAQNHNFEHPAGHANSAANQLPAGHTHSNSESHAGHLNLAHGNVGDNKNPAGHPNSNPAAHVNLAGGNNNPIGHVNSNTETNKTPAGHLNLNYGNVGGDKNSAGYEYSNTKTPTEHGNVGHINLAYGNVGSNETLSGHLNSNSEANKNLAGRFSLAHENAFHTNSNTEYLNSEHSNVGGDKNPTGHANNEQNTNFDSSSANPSRNHAGHANFEISTHTAAPTVSASTARHSYPTAGHGTTRTAGVAEKLKNSTPDTPEQLKNEQFSSVSDAVLSLSGGLLPPVGHNTVDVSPDERVLPVRGGRYYTPPPEHAGRGNSIEASTVANGFFVTKTNTFRPAEFITADFNSGSITGSKNTYIPTTKPPTSTEYVSNTFGFVKPTGVPKPRPFEPAATTERPVLTTVEPDYEDLYSLEYQISSASPFTNVPPTLPSSYHTGVYQESTPPVREHLDNMLDTLKEIASVREGARPGLLVPPSVGPQTLHTLAVYFANALDGLSEDQEPPTTVDEGLVINSLLSRKTVDRYNELFMREQEDDAEEQQDENDLDSEHSSNAVQSPRVRQLAKVFTQALSSYLDDPDMFRRVLQQVRPTEPPPLRTLPTDNPEEDELLNYSDADIKPELPRLPTPPPANPTWGYILAFNNSNHLDNTELQTADSQSFVPGYNDRSHWTQSPEVTQLWRNTLLIDPLVLNENLEKPETVDYELRALPKLTLNSTEVHGLLINFMNSTDDSAKLKRILDKLNTTQDEFLEKMKHIEENPLTRRLILLLVSECSANHTQDKTDAVRDILSLAQTQQPSNTDWEAVARRTNLTLERQPSAFTKLIDPNLKEEDQDARALQLLNSLYSIASKYGK